MLPRVADPVVLFEDEWILVVDKPSGLAVHSGAGVTDATVNDWAARYLGPRAIRNDFAASVAHRLDRETSGVVIIAKRRPAMRKLAEAFEQHAVLKDYLALVGGRLPHEEGRLDTPLMDLARPGRMQTAVTAYRVEERFPSATLIACSPGTGRKHQIRRHLAQLGCPVLGDSVYGAAGQNQQAAEAWGLRRMFLHARSLTFAHPRDGAPVHVVAPLPAELTGVVRALSAL